MTPLRGQHNVHARTGHSQESSVGPASLPPPTPATPIPDDTRIFVSALGADDGALTVPAPKLSVAGLRALKGTLRQIADGPILDFREREAARRLASLCDRLVEHDTGKYKLEPAHESRFRKEVAEGSAAIGRKYFRQVLAKGLGATDATGVDDGSTLRFERKGESLAVTMSPALELTSIRCRSGALSLAPPPTVARLAAQLPLALDTARALARHLGSLPAGTTLDTANALLTFERDGIRHFAAAGLILATSPGPAETPERTAARQSHRIRQDAFLAELTRIDSTAERALRAGQWQSGGHDLPRLRAAVERMRQDGRWHFVDTASLPVSVQAAVVRTAAAAAELRESGDILAGRGSYSSAPICAGRLLRPVDGNFELHRQSDRIVLLSRNASGVATKAVVLPTGSGIGPIQTYDIDSLVRSVAGGVKRSDAVAALRSLGQPAAPAIERLALDEKASGAARRAAMLLLHQAGQSRLGDDQSRELLADAFTTLLTRCQSGPRIGYASILTGRPGGAAPAVRAVLDDVNSTAFALAVAAESAGASGNRELIPELSKLLRHPDAQVVRSAAMALARLGDRRALASVRRVAEDSSSPDRAVAASLLPSFGRECTEWAATIAMKDPNVAKLLVDQLLADKNPMIGIVLRKHLRDGGMAALRGREGAALKVLERSAILGDAGAIQDLVLIASDSSIPKKMNGIRLLQDQQGPMSVELAAAVTLAHIERPTEVANTAELLLRTLSDAERTPHRARLQEIVRSRRLGLELIERFPPGGTRELVMKNRETARPDGRKLAIVVFPKSDYNGAFVGESGLVHSLERSGHRVMFYEARDVQGMVRALHDGAGIGAAKPQAASIVVLAGHGTQQTISFGYGSAFSSPEREHRDIYLGAADDRAPHGGATSDGRSSFLYTGHRGFLERELSRRVLAPDGQIVLESCSTGAGGPWKRPEVTSSPADAQPNNIANLLRAVFPHAKTGGIWSPMIPTSLRRLLFDSKTKELIDVEYNAPKDKRYRAALPPGSDRNVV